ALAALAGKAQVERLLHRLARPQVRQDLAAEELAQQPHAPARGVLLFARHAVARAHHAAFQVAALCYAQAAIRGVREAAEVRSERETGLGFDWPVVRMDAQVLVHAIGVHYLAGIHAVARIPDRLELAECLHELRAVHARQELRARLAVAVLARDRAAVLDHQVC